MTHKAGSRGNAKNATATATAPPVEARWTDVLSAEVSARCRMLVAEMRSETAVDPLLKAVVITDAEIDGVLARANALGARGEAEGQGRFVPGSLTHQLAECAPSSAHHLLVLQRRFGLGGFEMDCLLVALAGELDAKFERVFGYLNDNVSSKLPDAPTLLRLVAPGELALAAHLSREGRLLRYGLLLANDGARSGPYRVADGVVRYALEQGGLDATLARVWCDEDVPPLAAALWDTRVEGGALQALLRDGGGASASPMIVALRGRAGSGRRYLVEQACRRLGAGCVALDARKIKRGDAMERVLTAAFRDSALLGAPLLFHHADAWLDDAGLLAELRAMLQPLVRELGWMVVIASEAELNLASWFPAARVVELELPPLTTTAREEAWRLALATFPTLSVPARESLATLLAAKFRTTHGEIALATQHATSVSAWPSTDAGWSDLLHRMAGSVVAPRLHHLAHAMTVTHSLADLVLPADRIDALHDVVRRVRHRRVVLEDWAFEAVSNRGRGLIALFFGASGTGKTMAAEAIAAALRMQLFRIDLSGVVSKYIGETEKNLRAIFEEAERADSVLFFDEADALFGRRSEVKDAHDRYANIEINYLLQRIELFDGIAILATNKRSHIDEAFLRRIHVSVEFPVPRVAERLDLWDRSFPERAPLATDIDWDFLAQRFELTGGAIRNAALGAAFLAADTSGVIGMSEVVNALRSELVKSGRRVVDSEFGPHARHFSLPAVHPRHSRRAPLQHVGGEAVSLSSRG